MKRRAGFTLIELIIVMIIIGLLASISILKYIDLTRTARSAEVAGAFAVIRLAAYNYEADNNNQWPADVGPGVIPPELVPYLPGGFVFGGRDYTLDWENFTSGGGGAGFLLGITCTSTDAALAAKLVQVLGNQAPYYVVGNSLTYMIIDPSGNY